MTIKSKNKKISEIAAQSKKGISKQEKKKNWFSKLFSGGHRN